MKIADTRTSFQRVKAQRAYLVRVFKLEGDIIPAVVKDDIHMQRILFMKTLPAVLIKGCRQAHILAAPLKVSKVRTPYRHRKRGKRIAPDVFLLKVRCPFPEYLRARRADSKLLKKLLPGKNALHLPS